MFVVLAGCRGAGVLELTPLDYRHIDPPRAEVIDVHFDDCSWWTDEDGQLWVAARRSYTPLLLGEAARIDFVLTLRVEGPPAGTAREFQIGRDAFRARLTVGPVETRFASRFGIVAIYRKNGPAFDVRFRIRADRRTAQLLGGWSKPAGYLLLGRLQARENAERGRPLVALTESQGWERRTATTVERRPRAATQPASEPDRRLMPGLPDDRRAE